MKNWVKIKLEKRHEIKVTKIAIFIFVVSARSPERKLKACSRYGLTRMFKFNTCIYIISLLSGLEFASFTWPKCFERACSWEIPSVLIILQRFKDFSSQTFSNRRMNFIESQVLPRPPTPFLRIFMSLVVLFRNKLRVKVCSLHISRLLLIFSPFLVQNYSFANFFSAKWQKFNFKVLNLQQNEAARKRQLAGILRWCWRFNTVEPSTTQKFTA